MSIICRCIVVWDNMRQPLREFGGCTCFYRSANESRTYTSGHFPKFSVPIYYSRNVVCNISPVGTLVCLIRQYGGDICRDDIYNNSGLIHYVAALKSGQHNII